MYRYKYICRDIDIYLYLCLNVDRFLDCKMFLFLLIIKGFKLYIYLLKLIEVYKEALGI